MGEIPGRGEEGLVARLERRFNPDAREALIHNGYAIYTLTGASIQSHRETGRSFFSTWHQPYADFEALPSRRNMEVAIDVGNPYLPYSNNRTLREQLGLIEQHSRRLSGKIPGVRAIMGEAADYIEFAFRHFDATRASGNTQYLFGADNHVYNKYARTPTVTPSPDGNVAGVGWFHPIRGLAIYRWPAEGRITTVHAVPLIIPAKR